MHKSILVFSLLLELAACSAPTPLPSTPAAVYSASALWRFESATHYMRDKSCPAGTFNQPSMTIDISASRVELGDALPPSVTFAGGWSLSSSNTNFGGLSGLETLPDGNLLAISDTGTFVWIGMSDREPDGSGQISYMLDADGAQLSGKTEADAEGLVFQDGIALVSFERNHRIEAFDLADCGASAKATEVARLPFDVAGIDIDENQGVEALSILPDGALKFGLESFKGGPSPMGNVFTGGKSALSGERAANPRGYSLVGLDEAADADGQPVTVTLYRSYDPIRGNRNVITLSTSDMQIELKRPMLVDNFEGIAAEFMDADTLRIWLISDNNFSPRQQTLLYAFNVSIRKE